MSGERIYDLSEEFLQITFKEVKTCAILCEKEYKSSNSFDKSKLELLRRGMKLNYQHHW